MEIDIVLAVCLLTSTFIIHSLLDIRQILRPAVFFFVYSVVFLYIGAFWRFLYEPAIVLDQRVLLLLAACLVTYSMGVGVGMLDFAAGRLMSVKSKPLVLKWTPTAEYWALVSISVLWLGILASLLYFFYLGQIPMLAANAESFRVVSREGIGKVFVFCENSVKYGAFGVVLVELSRPRRSRQAWFLWGSVLVGAVVILGFGHRAPPLEILLFIIVAISLRKGSSFSVRSLLIIGAVFLAMIGALHLLRRGLEVSVLGLGLTSLWRPFASLQNVNYILEYFPSSHPFLFGRSLVIDSAVLLPGYQPNFGMWLKEVMGLDFAGGGVTTTYIGEAYVNWGFPSTIIWAFMIGVVLTRLSRFAGTISPQAALLLGLLSFALSGLATSTLTAVILYSVLPPLLLHTYGWSQVEILIGAAGKPEHDI